MTNQMTNYAEFVGGCVWVCLAGSEGRWPWLRVTSRRCRGGFSFSPHSDFSLYVDTDQNNSTHSTASHIQPSITDRWCLSRENINISFREYIVCAATHRFRWAINVCSAIYLGCEIACKRQLGCLHAYAFTANTYLLLSFRLFNAADVCVCVSNTPGQAHINLPDVTQTPQSRTCYTRCFKADVLRLFRVKKNIVSVRWAFVLLARTRVPKALRGWGDTRSDPMHKANSNRNRAKQPLSP